MIETLVEQWGLLALFVGAAVEGETVLLLGGAAVHEGLLLYIPAVLAAVAGSMVADQSLFLIGRRAATWGFARRLLARPVAMKVMALVNRHPTGFVLSFRFLWGLRTISPLAVGTTAMSWPRFATLNAIAATVWAGLFIGIGAGVGSGLESLGGDFRRTEVLVAAMLLLGAALAATTWAVARRRRRRR